MIYYSNPARVKPPRDRITVTVAGRPVAYEVLADGTTIRIPDRYGREAVIVTRMHTEPHYTQIAAGIMPVKKSKYQGPPGMATGPRKPHNRAERRAQEARSRNKLGRR